MGKRNAQLATQSSQLITSTIATQLTPTITPISSSKSTPSNYNEFNGLCVHLVYPNDFVKKQENIISEHIKGPGGINLYGESSLILSKKEYQLTLTCYPRNNPDIERYLRNAQESTKKFTETTGQKVSSIEKIKLLGLDAFYYTTYADYSETGIIRGGKEAFLGIKGNYIIEVIIHWNNIEGNDPNDPIRKEFESLMNTIQIKDIFNNQ